MKTKKEILESTPIFLNGWEGSKQYDIFLDFYQSNYSLTKEEISKVVLASHQGEKILFASYNSEGYEGYAFVIFSKNGQLYEVNGSHCSCYGLEDQWTPEKVNLKELRTRSTKGGFGDYLLCKDEFIKFLGINDN